MDKKQLSAAEEARAMVALWNRSSLDLYGQRVVDADDAAKELSALADENDQQRERAEHAELSARYADDRVEKMQGKLLERQELLDSSLSRCAKFESVVEAAKAWAQKRNGSVAEACKRIEELEAAVAALDDETPPEPKHIEGCPACCLGRVELNTAVRPSAIAVQDAFKVLARHGFKGVVADPQLVDSLRGNTSKLVSLLFAGNFSKEDPNAPPLDQLSALRKVLSLVQECRRAGLLWAKGDNSLLDELRDALDNAERTTASGQQ